VESVLQLTLPIFALVFCGYAGRRLGPITDATVEAINQFVFLFALPAMLFRVAATNPLTDLFNPQFAWAWICAGLTTYLIAYSVGRRWLGANRAQSAAWSLTATHGNVGYMGLPLAAELGGAKALAPFLTTVILDIFVIITITIALLEVERGRVAPTDSEQDEGLANPQSGVGRALPQARLAPSGKRILAYSRVLRTVLRGVIRSPLVASIALGLAWSATTWKLPSFLDTFTRLLGGAAGPAALFAIGASLVKRETLERGGPTVPTLTCIKLLIHPALAALTMLVLFPVAPYPAAIGVLAASLPSASNGFIIAQRYGLDVQSVGSAIVNGTTLALPTVTLVIWCLGIR